MKKKTTVIELDKRMEDVHTRVWKLEELGRELDKQDKLEAQKRKDDWHFYRGLLSGSLIMFIVSGFTFIFLFFSK